MMIRFLLTVFLLCSPIHVLAQTAQGSAAVEVAADDPVKKRSTEIDRLFGQLHQNGLSNSQQAIEKIWTLWSANESPMAEILLTQSGKALRDGAFETSETMLNELIGSYPDYTQALNQRAMVYYNQRRYDDAQYDLETVLETEPRHFGALSGLAAIYQAKGNPAKAAGYLRDAISVNPYLESAKTVLKQLEHDYPNI